MAPGTSIEKGPSNPGIRLVADYGNLCGEGPLWDDRNQVLYWTDITGKRFFRYWWKNQRHEPIHEGFEVGGFCIQEGGGFVVTNSQGIWLWSPGGKPALLASEAEGKECIMNDCIADPEGRVYSGSCHYDPSGDYPPSFLFRVDVDGSVQTADAQGFVWCAHWFGGCLTRYDPDGKLERRITTPAAQTSSLTFGGPDLNEIFVTSAAASNVLSLAPLGYEPEKLYVGGPLYQLSTNIRGKKEYRSRVTHPSREPR